MEGLHIGAWHGNALGKAQEEREYVAWQRDVEASLLRYPNKHDGEAGD